MYPSLPPSLLNGATHEDIEELTSDATEQLKELRACILTRYETSGLTFTPDFNHDLPTTHWRDIYAAHRHLTDIDISPDVRNTPEYDEALYSPSTQPCNWSDALLNHFLVARKHDIPAAAKMFANYLAWRHQFGVDDLARQHPMPFDDIIESIISHRIHLYDKSGYPMYLQRTGLIDPNQFTERVSDPVLALTHVHHMEMCMTAMHESSIKHRRRIDKLVTVIDTAHVTLTHAKTVKFFSITSFIDQHFYPEMLSKLFMINAPHFLPSLLSMAKRFLDKKTSDKIYALSSNELPQLIEQLGANNLPMEWLGKCDCPGGCIPLVDSRRKECEFHVEQLQSKTNPSDIQSISNMVSAGKSFSVDVELSSDVQTFWVCASIVNKDVLMTVTIDHPDTTPHLVIQPLRVDAQLYNGKCRAFHQFAKPISQGKLTIKIDNSFSRFTSKEVQLQWALIKSE